MKRIIVVLCTFLIVAFKSTAQSPNYSFSVAAATSTEANVSALAGYVKADTAPITSDSVLIVLTAGRPRPSHMDTMSSYVIRFNPGLDSVPFRIQLFDDTFPEYPEHVTYVLRNYGSAAGIGTDSILNFTLLDNDLPASINFVIDTGSAWLHDGTFAVCETINNPNNFYVRYRRYTYDGYTNSSFYNSTALGGYNYFYDRDTAYAPPGISTICQNITIVPNNSLGPDLTLVCVLFDIDANNITDSLFFFTIKNDNYYYPPSVSFDISHAIVIKDSAAKIGIPLTTINPNHLPFSFIVDTMLFHTSLPIGAPSSSYFTFYNNYFSHPGGTWHDTLWVNILDDHLIFDTTTVTFRIKGVSLNTSPDTLFQLTIIDTGSLIVSFKGAGFAHLKDDSIGYVLVYTSAPVDYPVTVAVTYLNGNAVAGVDYLWHDTIVTFPPNMFDTISLPVVMLKNHIHDGNKQVNFQLSNVNPASVQYDILQYTYTIIDNDSTAIYPSGINNIDDKDLIKVYPNPFNTEIGISSNLGDHRTIIYDLMGEVVYEAKTTGNSEFISTISLPDGIYIIRVTSSASTYSRMVSKGQ